MRTRISSNTLTCGLFLVALACSSNPASLGQYSAGSLDPATGGSQGTSNSTGDTTSVASTTMSSTGASAGIGGSGTVASTSDSVTPTTPAPQELTCPLLAPSRRVFYPGDSDSPCPTTAPRIEDPTRSCPRSLVGVPCAYPAQYPDAQDIWTCTEEGGTLDANGQLIPGTTVTAWETPGPTLCKRTGNNCLLGNPQDQSGPRTQVSTSCVDRAQIMCEIQQDITSQDALDRLMASRFSDCYAEANLQHNQRTSLTVWFEGDCAKEFIVFPASLTSCVQKHLETERYDCAAGLVCGATASSGGCDLC